MLKFRLLAGWLLIQNVLLAAEQPNIIVILSDDMGYSDLGCYGGEITTPNLDRLASNGLRFTQFYNMARCCPTRASLLTGLYPHQAGVGHMTNDGGQDGFRGDLNRQCVTIAEALRPAGYRNYMAGKWHVTRHTQPEGPKHNWPMQRGFDHYYGTIVGAGTFFDPAGLCRDNTMIPALTDPEYQPKQYYYTQALSDHARRFVSEHQRNHADKPFFMYLAYTAAHWPMHALEEDIQKQRGRYDAGYDAIRQARFAKARKLGLIDPAWKLTPTKGDWDSVQDQAWEARCMEVYAAMIESMDRGIGELVEELRSSGQLDNTLILFLQDNGGCAENTGRQPNVERGVQPSLPVVAADQVLLPVQPKQTRDGWPMLTGRKVMPGPRDTYIAYGEGWANVSNTPFREYKHWVHEGGISTPLIAHWPKRISNRGEVRHQPGHLIDIMATCVDVSGASYPQEHAGEKIIPLEGRSLVPAFGDGKIERDAIYWEHEGNRAIRVGDWKLVAKGPAAPWELYDLKVDRTETADLAAQHPERVREMTAKWESWAHRAKVLPWIWKPQYGQPDTSDDSTDGSPAVRFELKSGGTLARGKAPRSANKPLSIAVAVSESSPNGVLVAQGGTANGYSLYVKNNKLTFAVRRRNTLATVVATEALPAAPLEITATLSSKGAVVLTANKKQIGSGKLDGPMVSQPADGLQVGRDENGAVGDYEAPFAYSGKIDGVVIELREP
ncbi:MAG: atsA 19 [Schlesneria sp.]|nr:atsA 19 [Schlesneria sp.]